MIRPILIVGFPLGESEKDVILESLRSTLTKYDVVGYESKSIETISVRVLNEDLVLDDENLSSVITGILKQYRIV